MAAQVMIGRRQLTVRELRFLRDALKLAAAKYHEDASEWVEVQERLQHGEKMPMVAAGTRGVEACRRMIAQLHELESGTRELLALVTS